MDKPQKALEYLYKSLAIRTELDDRLGMAINYTNLGSNYSKIARYDSALMFIKKGAELFEILGDKSGSSNACALMGEITFKQKQYRNSITWCDKAQKLAEEMGKVPMQRIACHCLYQSYKAMGNMGKALEFHEKYKLFGDSLKKAEIEVRLHQMEFDKEILTDSLVREEEKHLIRMGYQADLNKKTQVRNVILVVSIGILLLALVFLSRMLYFQKRSENFQLETQKLEKQQLINEVALLRTQVNPHFLFNSLSILSSLVHINADLSEQFIDQLSRSYRYILEQKDQTLVTLRTELEFIRSYAFLLKIRFENKFDLRIQLAESDLDAYKIAPLTLQLLVENAVKHNRMSAAEPLVVEVLREGDFLFIKNCMQLRPQREESTRMGLQNIINRYALITDRCVWAGEQDGVFVVKVPLLSS
jgi:tetratricopeptide (TPR) repeat protein